MRPPTERPRKPRQLGKDCKVPEASSGVLAATRPRRASYLKDQRGLARTFSRKTPKVISDLCPLHLQNKKIVVLFAGHLQSVYSVLNPEVKNVCSVAQSCPALCNPMDCSLPGSAAHGIFQARILKWVAISYSKESS